MSSTNIVTGRPKTACDKCKSLKIRCSTRRPVCDRCLRIGHDCVYSKDTVTPSKVTKRFKRSVPSLGPSQQRTLPAIASSPGVDTRDGIRSLCDPLQRSVSTYHLSNSRLEDCVGISLDLVVTLAEVYFRHVYNAGLLLHKPSFLHALDTGSANPHITLSVCAWGAKFYQDRNGEYTFKQQGLMHEWAKRAGEFAFKEAEQLQGDNIVTHLNLCLFWFSEGSWPRAYIHKANARSLIQVLGTGSKRKEGQDLKLTEMRRRRFYAHYMMNCHMPTAGPPEYRKSIMSKIPLPGPEENLDLDFDASLASLTGCETMQRSIYAQMIKILTLWADVNFFIRSLKDTFRESITKVYALDEELRDWWHNLRSEWKMSISTFSEVPADLFPKILLINVAYHQCLFALHAAVVPLFAPTECSINWNTARQLSAQIAFEHASATSELISAVVLSGTQLNTIPHFVAWSGYSACAILIPFLKSSHDGAKRRAMSYVQANSKLIAELAKHWRFAQLLELYLANLRRSYDKYHVVLEDEPKNLAIQRLSTFRIKSEYARATILGYIQVLENDGEGLIEPGEEKLDLGIDDYAHEQDPNLSTGDASVDLSQCQANTSLQMEHSLPALIGQNELATEVPFGCQDWHTWPLELHVAPEMPDMFTLTSHPWNDITSSFEGGWSPDMWPNFSACTFNNG